MLWRSGALGRWALSAGLVLLVSSAPPAWGDLNLGPEELVQANDFDIAVPGWSVPSFVHWNNDGLEDLVVGEGGSLDNGKVRVYLNDGAPGHPHFTDYFNAQSSGSDLVVPPDG